MKRPAAIRSVWIALRSALWRRATYEWEPATSNVRFVGLDVHAETIAVAVAEANGEVRSLGMIPTRVGAAADRQASSVGPRVCGSV